LKAFAGKMAGRKALAFSVIVVFLLVVGILNVILQYEENKCEMTWMFEQPQYLVNIFRMTK
jgi:hypothetical protein